jgi:hypothetical protein
MWANTKEMAYSTKWHMYILDVEYVKNTLGLDFIQKEGSKTRAQDKMYQISRVIYNYIYVHTQRQKLIEYNLAMVEEYRPIIQEVLEWQTRFEYESNPLLLSMQLGVNPLNGITINLNDLRGQRVIAKQAEDILLYKNLLYTGGYNNVTRDSELDYDTLGY